MCEEVSAQEVERGWEFCEALSAHPQTSHSFPSRCSRSWRPGLWHLGMGSWSTKALWAWARPPSQMQEGRAGAQALAQLFQESLPSWREKAQFRGTRQPLKVLITPCLAGNMGSTYCFQPVA